ncbi:glucosaminidase domain-containing protein [Candidatus Roizmanbacteria bacterium]|nr:glucosaminidase domain-containing protein [Candidatus Roizmanbacteria bacterium]
MKRIFLILVILLLSLFFPQKILAEKIADNSAVMANNNLTNKNVNRLTKKKIVISKVLTSYNSPLVNSTEYFISACVNYNLDCYLLPSIAGLESFFARFVYPNSNNPFGWGGGYIMFTSWERAIDTVGRGLRENYIDKGADTVEKIAPIYATSQTWASKVNYFKEVFEKEEKKIDLILSKNGVKL